MFPCGICLRTTEPGEKATRLVVKTRTVIYPKIFDAHQFRMEGKKEIRDDPGGRGIEIVQEVTACPACAIGG